MYNYLENLLVANDVTAYAVAKSTGIPVSTFYDWKAGRSIPKADKLQKIADYFNVSMEELMTGEQKTPTPEGMSASQQQLIDFVRSLSPDEVERLQDMAKLMMPERFQDK